MKRVFRNGNWITLVRAQLGWKCEVLLNVSTSEQSTDVPVSYETGSRWFLVALVKGLWGARQQKKRLEYEHAELRKHKGW